MKKVEGNSLRGVPNPRFLPRRDLRRTLDQPPVMHVTEPVSARGRCAYPLARHDAPSAATCTVPICRIEAQLYSDSPHGTCDRSHGPQSDSLRVPRMSTAFVTYNQRSCVVVEHLPSILVSFASPVALLLDLLCGNFVSKLRQESPSTVNMSDQAKYAESTVKDSTDKAVGTGKDAAGNVEKGASDATSTAQSKGAEAKDHAGGLFQQATKTVSDTFNNIKHQVTGK